MSSRSDDLSRRDFLKTAAACGAGSILAAAGDIALGQPAAGSAEGAQSQPTTGAVPLVPRRLFGTTGRDVSILALGGIFDITANQLVLKQALKWGIDYWDTAASYVDGKSELGIGMFFGASPQERKRVFLVTKSKDGPELESSLNRSLERMKTDYVDVFFIHDVSQTSVIEDRGAAWKAFARKAKAAKKIRFFGFSTHSNMAPCLQAASKLDFIDAVIFRYNFRRMDEADDKAAVEAASKAGIGLTAMKTQAKPSRREQAEGELTLLDQFTQRGFSAQQAALKAVWEDPRIASLCSAMYTLEVLQSNYLAAIDKTQLSAADRAALREYAQASCWQYCAGCADTCQSAVAGRPPIADVMRYLMYHREYGRVEDAQRMFAELPASVRAALAHGDFSAAERRCPQRMAIGRLMREACDVLA
ncbi:MAG: aldo/keto reductase [Phycisphaerae bacterium]|nr:aldo/keto reductase [Phycisphaerae bacterium]